MSGVDWATVTLVTDPSMREPIRDVLQSGIASMAVDGGRSAFGESYGMPLTTPPPMHLGFDVYARSGDEERWLCRMFTAANAYRTRNVERLMDDVRDLFTDDAIDLIFRTNPAAVEQSATITEIWNGEVLIENVRLRGAAK